MSAGRYLQLCRVLLPLTAAAALAACSSNPDAFGEPFAVTERDGGTEPSETAGRSSKPSDAGHDATLDNDADSGSGSGSSVGGHVPEAGAGGTPTANGGAGTGHQPQAGVGGSTAGSSGAGNTGSAGSAGAAGHPAAVSFSDIYTGILAMGCSCHNGGAGGLDLASRSSAYTNLVGVASTNCPSEQRVVPGKPSASVLVHSLAHTVLGTCTLPNMPRGGAMLTQAQLDQITAWISAGARND